MHIIGTIVESDVTWFNRRIVNRPLVAEDRWLIHLIGNAYKAMLDWGHCSFFGSLSIIFMERGIVIRTRTNNWQTYPIRVKMQLLQCPFVLENIWWYIVQETMRKVQSQHIVRIFKIYTIETCPPWHCWLCHSGTDEYHKAHTKKIRAVNINWFWRINSIPFVEYWWFGWISIDLLSLSNTWKTELIKRKHWLGVHSFIGETSIDFVYCILYSRKFHIFRSIIHLRLC